MDKKTKENIKGVIVGLVPLIIVLGIGWLVLDQVKATDQNNLGTLHQPMSPIIGLIIIGIISLSCCLYYFVDWKKFKKNIKQRSKCQN